MKIAVIKASDSAAFQEPEVLGELYAGQSYRDSLPPDYLAEVDASEVVLAEFAPWGVGAMRVTHMGIPANEIEVVEFDYYTRWRRRTWPECPRSKVT